MMPERDVCMQLSQSKSKETHKAVDTVATAMEREGNEERYLLLWEARYI